MPHCSDLEKSGLVDALGVKEADIYEAGFNLVGFFSVLQKIEQRVSKENALNKKGDAV